MIYHNVMRLDISMHDTFRVAIVKSFQNFIDIKSNVIISERLVKSSEINITSVNILHDQSRGFCHWISNYINQVDDVNTASESLQNFDFSSDFSFLDWFENLDDNSFIIQRVNSFINFRIFSSSNFLNNLIVFLGSTLQKD